MSGSDRCEISTAISRTPLRRRSNNGRRGPTQVRRQMLVVARTVAEPARTPLNPVIHGRLDQGDYTVEKVYFESMPGFFVTGSLFRPKGKPGKCPGVLCPHGHWANGRFYDADRDGDREADRAGRRAV